MKEENEQEVANNDTETKETEAVEDKLKEELQLPNGEKVIVESSETEKETDNNTEETNTESPNLDNEIIESDGTKDWIYAPYEFISGGKHNGLSVSTYGFQIDKGAIIMTVVEKDGNISNDIEFIPEARIIKHEDGTKSIK